MPIKLLHNNVNNNEVNSLLKNNTVFVGVFSKTCIHCINMKPEWKKFKNMVNKEKLNGIILEIDANMLSNISNPLINNNAQGFPSLFIIKNNNFITSYNEERKAENFMNFFKQFISKEPKKLSKKTSRKKFKIVKHKIKNKIKNTLKKLKTINIDTFKKSKKYFSKLRLRSNIGLCKHAKNGINGCSICCSQFKKRKTYKKCIKKCMK